MTVVYKDKWSGLLLTRNDGSLLKDYARVYWDRCPGIDKYLCRYLKLTISGFAVDLAVCNGVWCVEAHCASAKWSWYGSSGSGTLFWSTTLGRWGWSVGFGQQCFVNYYGGTDPCDPTVGTLVYNSCNDAGCIGGNNSMCPYNQAGSVIVSAWT